MCFFHILFVPASFRKTSCVIQRFLFKITTPLCPVLPPTLGSFLFLGFNYIHLCIAPTSRGCWKDRVHRCKACGIVPGTRRALHKFAAITTATCFIGLIGQKNAEYAFQFISNYGWMQSWPINCWHLKG